MSREAAEQTDVDQSPSGWEQLEKRLNKEMPQEEKRRRFLWVFFLFLLLGGSGLTFLLSRVDKSNNTKPISAAPANADAATQKAELKNDAPPVKGAASRENKKGETIVTTDKIDKLKKEGNAKKPLTQKEPAANYDEDNRTVADLPEQSKSSTEQKTPDLKRKIAGTKPSGQKGNVVSLALEKNNLRKRTDSKDLRSGKNKPLKEDSEKNQLATTEVKRRDEVTSTDAIDANTKNTDAVPPTPNKTDAITKNVDSSLVENKQVKIDSLASNPVAQKVKTKSSLVNRWTIGLYTGTDISRINGTANNKKGYVIGSMLSYDLTKRFTVSAGFLFTQKFYSAKASDYNPPPHHISRYLNLVSLDGNCEMWELPLNLRYNVIKRPRSSWFVNAGSSSYIMRKQFYDYEHIDQGVLAKRSWKTASQQNDWFKILNLSVGFEKSISRSFSVQAEPYARIPLSGVGYGKMDISTYGILVGVKYRPLFKK